MARNQCRGEYNQHLSAYLDGELSTAERTLLLQHLAVCQSCRARLDEYRGIGTRVRGLPPVIVPEELTAAIYVHTVDAPPRRLLHLTNRVAYPAAAIAAVLLVFVVAVFLLVDGYQRSIDPTIVGSSPTNQIMWNYTDPVRITFNKEMDRASVEAALTIIPTSERDRLHLTWEGNTLVIGGNAALRPGTSYSVGVTTEARDKWGNRLSEPFALDFSTNDRFTVYESVPTPEPSSTATAEVVPAAVSTPEPARPTSTAEPRPPANNEPAPEVATSTQETASGSTDDDGGQPPPPPPPPQDPPQQEPDPPPPPPPANTPVPPPPVEEPTEVPPTETPVPPPTEEPTEVPPPTETPEPPTPTIPPEPTVTPTPDTVAVTGAFGNVYWRHDVVQENLGAPTDAESAITVQELDFQRGKMLLIHETGQVFIMQTWGAWELLPDTSGDELPEFVEVDDAGLWEPGGALGFIWHSDPYYLEALGYAVDSEAHTYDSLIQRFESGRMIYSPEGFIYVLYERDVMWELYPDTGSLSEANSAP